MSILEVSHVALWVVAILIAPLAICLVYLLSVQNPGTNNSSEKSANGSPINAGERFPSFVALDLRLGAECDSVDLFRGSARMFLAVQPGCPACSIISAELASFSRQELAQSGLVIVCFSSVDSCKQQYESLEAVPLLKGGLSNSVLAEAGLPTVFVVDEVGLVRSVHVGASSLRKIIDEMQTRTAGDSRSIDPVFNTEGGL